MKFRKVVALAAEKRKQEIRRLQYEAEKRRKDEEERRLEEWLEEMEDLDQYN